MGLFLARDIRLLTEEAYKIDTKALDLALLKINDNCVAAAKDRKWAVNYTWNNRDCKISAHFPSLIHNLWDHNADKPNADGDYIKQNLNRRGFVVSLSETSLTVSWN